MWVLTVSEVGGEDGVAVGQVGREVVGEVTDICVQESDLNQGILEFIILDVLEDGLDLANDAIEFSHECVVSGGGSEVERLDNIN